MFRSFIRGVIVPVSSRAFPPSCSRCFHPSLILLAKKNNKTKGGSNENGSEASEVVLPDVKVYDTKMIKRIDGLKEELSQIRGGSASRDMLNSITVSAYGSRIPLTEAGQITLKTPSTLSISVFDAALLPFVVTALKDSGMNLTPVVEGGSIAVNVPKPSKEQRELQVKLLSKIVEKAKQDIRQIRKDGIDGLKKLKGKVSEDDTRRLTKTIDGVVEGNVEKITKLQKEKEKELLSM